MIFFIAHRPTSPEFFSFQIVRIVHCADIMAYHIFAELIENATSAFKIKRECLCVRDAINAAIH